MLHFAHQGGELEAPSNTLYAFKTAVAKGATALEMDLHVTRDDQIVVCHDPDVDRTTNGLGPFDAMTLEEVKALDAAYWFVPGRDSVRDADDYPLRGIATGFMEPPDGFAPDDFRVPTLRKVLEAFPDVYLNMDIKGSSGYDDEVAALLDEFGRRDDVIVASFNDETIAKFRAIAPGVSTAAAMDETRAVWAHEAVSTGPFAFQALQAPWEVDGREVVNADRMRRARDAGLAVHIWTVNDEDVMRRLLDHGVDGIMTARPTLLARVLASR